MAPARGAAWLATQPGETHGPSPMQQNLLPREWAEPRPAARATHVAIPADGSRMGRDGFRRFGSGSGGLVLPPLFEPGVQRRHRDAHALGNLPEAVALAAQLERAGAVHRTPRTPDGPAAARASPPRALRGPSRPLARPRSVQPRQKLNQAEHGAVLGCRGVEVLLHGHESGVQPPQPLGEAQQVAQRTGQRAQAGDGDQIEEATLRVLEKTLRSGRLPAGALAPSAYSATTAQPRCAQ